MRKEKEEKRKRQLELIEDSKVNEGHRKFINDPSIKLTKAGEYVKDIMNRWKKRNYYNN